MLQQIYSRIHNHVNWCETTDSWPSGLLRRRGFKSQPGRADEILKRPKQLSTSARTFSHHLNNTRFGTANLLVLAMSSRMREFQSLLSNRARGTVGMKMWIRGQAVLDMFTPYQVHDWKQLYNFSHSHNTWQNVYLANRSFNCMTPIFNWLNLNWINFLHIIGMTWHSSYQHSNFIPINTKYSPK